MKKRTTSTRVGRLQGASVEGVQTDQHVVPAGVAALFDRLLSRSVRAARADHRLRTELLAANAKFKRAEARLFGSLAERLGVSATVKELAVLREGHQRTVSDAMEKAHAVVNAAGRSDQRTRKKKRKAR
jgi:hypothetical protein